MQLPTTIPADKINYQVQQILQSPAFRNSPTLSRFLTYIISETLTKKEQHIKEYSIALNVLNRSRSFNPQDDAVVRIHAGRLRRALNEYYLIRGINDPILIDIPKGGYIPQFEWRSNEKTVGVISGAYSEQVIHPIIAVFPFRAIPQSEDVKTFSMILGEQLSAELSGFHGISVIGYFTSDMLSRIEDNIMEAGKLLDAHYIITGSVQYKHPNLRIVISLICAATGEVKMVKSIEKEGEASNLFEVWDDMMYNVLEIVAALHDIIFEEMAKATPGAVLNRTGVNESINTYFKYKQSYAVENFQAALSTLQRVVKENPDHAASYAMLGELYLDGMALGTMHGDDPLTLAHQYVIRSFKIEPLCQHAWYVLGWIHLVKKEKEACLLAARQCIQLNPDNSVMSAGVAFLLFCAGYFDKGLPFFEKAAKSGYDSLWMNTGGSFYYLYKKQYATALFWAEKMKAEESFWDPLLKCVSLSYLDKKEEARKYLTRLLSIEPETPRKIRLMLSTIILSDELITLILNGLKQLGFEEERVSPGNIND